MVVHTRVYAKWASPVWECLLLFLYPKFICYRSIWTHFLARLSMEFYSFMEDDDCFVEEKNQ